MKIRAEEFAALQEGLVSVRRALHRVPEIGGSLPRTQKIVCDFLEERGICYRSNRADDGIVVDIEGKGPGRTIALRADMDALHISEETPVPFRSEIAGQMHGCGHDVHTAVLLYTADVLNRKKDRFSGRVRLLFQTGEETGTGAKTMISEGALEGVDAIASLHVGNLAGETFRSGDVVILSGPVTSGKDKFTITVKGKGTHSAFPEKGIDPILVAARIANGCEEIFARELPAGTAAVLSFGSFRAGEDHNTIPSEAVLKGSIRVQSDALREFIGERMKKIAASIAEAYRAEAVVDLKKGSVTVRNDENLSALAFSAVKDVLGEEKVFDRTPSALMGSDDFANYASRIPGLYFFLHTNNEEKGIVKTNHNPAFDVDEDVIWEGVAAYTAIVFQYLK